MNFTIFIPIYCFGHQTDIPTGQYLNDWMFSSGSLREFLYSHVWIEVFTPAKVLAKWRWYLVEGWQNIHWWIFSFFSVSLVSYANPTFLFVTHYKNKMLTKYWFHWYKRNYITTLATCRIPRSRVYQTSVRVAINCNRNCARQISFFFSKILFRLRLDVQESRLLPFVKVTNYNVPKEVITMSQRRSVAGVWLKTCDCIIRVGMTFQSLHRKGHRYRLRMSRSLAQPNFWNTSLGHN